MDLPLISILMPIYNDETVVGHCLESIHKQSFSNFEVIVVDDGSTDQSKEMLAEFARSDSRIRIFGQTHKGIVDSLNFGLSHCRGKYIARMDGDDWMDPQRLEKQLEFIEKHKDLGLIGSLVEGIPQTTPYQQWSNSLVTHEAIENELFVESPIMHPTFFGRREVFEALEGYRAHPWAEDYDFLLRASQQKIRFGKVAEYLVRKKDSPTRLSRTDWKYKRPAMFEAKVHYFLKSGFLKEKKGVVIAGTGSSGRKIATRFKAFEIPLLCFVDNRTGPPDRTVMGIPAYGIATQIPEVLFKILRDAFVILAIGDQKGREHLLQLLDTATLPKDEKIEFLRFI